MKQDWGQQRFTFPSSFATRQDMDEALKALMDKLAVVGESYPELYDTAVREQLAGAMFNGFVRPREGWSASEESFGMFSDDGNAAVREVVAEFLRLACAQGASLTLEERIKAIWNYNVRSSSGRTPDDFLGAI